MELDSILARLRTLGYTHGHPMDYTQWTLNFVPDVYRNGRPRENEIPLDKRASGLVLGLSVA